MWYNINRLKLINPLKGFKMKKPNCVNHLLLLVDEVTIKRCIINSITFPQRPLNLAAYTTTLMCQ